MKKTKKSSLIIKILIIFFMMLIIPNLIDVLNAESNYVYYDSITAPPNLYLETEFGQRIELVLASYTLAVNDKIEKVELVDDIYTYDFKSNNKRIFFTKNYYEIKSEENINFENYEFETRDVLDLNNCVWSSGGDFEGNVLFCFTPHNEGEYLNIIKIYTEDKSFCGTYIFKEVVVEKNSLYKTKLDYISTKDEDKISKIIDKVPFAKLLNSYKLENDTMTLEYNVQFSEKDLNKIAKTIMVCIDNLKKVKIIVNDKSTTNALYLEWESYEYKPLPIKEYVLTLDDFKDDKVSIETMKEYLRK